MAADVNHFAVDDASWRGEEHEQPGCHRSPPQEEWLFHGLSLREVGLHIELVRAAAKVTRATG